LETGVLGGVNADFAMSLGTMATVAQSPSNLARKDFRVCEVLTGFVKS